LEQVMKASWIALCCGTLLFAAVAGAQEERGSAGLKSEYAAAKGEVDYGGVTLGYGPQVPKLGEDIYRVARGDTLWGICGRFFGDPQTWPSLWSINNEEITNPHYIYPGQVLRFTPGTDIYPPQFSVGDLEPGSYEFEEEFQDVVRFLAGQQECGVEKPFKMRDFRYRVSAHGFIIADARDREEMKLGEVYASKEMSSLLGQEQEIYLQYDDDTIEDVNCGDIYTIYREMRDVRHPKVRRAKLGTMYAVVGETRITDVNLRTNIATAEIVENWAAVARGDLITDRVPVSSMVSERQVQGQVEGYVVDSINQDAILSFPRDIVFIDRGRNAGVEVGTVFWVMRRGDPMATKLRDRKKSERLPQYVIAKLVVFSTDESHATAVVVDASQSLEAGDRVYTVVEEADLR